MEKIIDKFKKKGRTIPFADRLPCKVLKAERGIVTPDIWKNCRHDAYPWYESSEMEGKYLIVTTDPLPEEYAALLDCIITESNFSPESYPTGKRIKELHSSEIFKKREPREWYRIPPNFSAKMSEAFKIALGISKPIEEMRGIWSAIHSNFMEGKISINEDGKVIPYTIADTNHTATCCIELFNIIGAEFKVKLVKTSLGAKTMNALESEKYYRVESMRGIK